MHGETALKTKIWISFNALPIPGGAAAILAPANCGTDVADVNDVPVLRQIFVDVKLDETDERAAKVFALLKLHGIEPKSFTYTEYSEEDRQNARLLRMSIEDINTACHVSRDGGTQYDMSEACPHCETGARQLRRHLPDTQTARPASGRSLRIAKRSSPSRP